MNWKFWKHQPPTQKDVVVKWVLGLMRCPCDWAPDAEGGFLYTPLPDIKLNCLFAAPSYGLISLDSDAYLTVKGQAIKEFGELYGCIRQYHRDVENAEWAHLTEEAQEKAVGLLTQVMEWDRLGTK